MINALLLVFSLLALLAAFTAIAFYPTAPLNISLGRLAVALFFTLGAMVLTSVKAHAQSPDQSQRLEPVAFIPELLCVPLLDAPATTES